MWRPRDRERFIGSYDPEHEMPDPDRGPGDRWQSDAYRNAARDSRFAYRWNPDRFEERFSRDRGDYDRGPDTSWRDSYGRGGYDYDRDRDYSRGFNADRDWGRDYDPNRDYGRDHGRDYGSDYGRDRDYDRGFSGGGYDRDRHYGSDRGWDYPRGGAYFEGDFGPPGRDSRFDEYGRDRWRRR